MSKVAIATKIDHNSKLMMEAIAQKAGLKVSNLLCTVVDSFLRYCANDEKISKPVLDVLNCFAKVQVAKNSLCLCDLDGTQKKINIQSCIYFLEAQNKPQPRAILVYTKTNKKGEKETFECKTDDGILKNFLLAFEPNLIKELQEIMQGNSLYSLSDALKFAINNQNTPPVYNMAEDIKSMFADNQRHEWGNDTELVKYKRHYATTVDQLEIK